MKQFLKKFFALALALCMLLCMMPESGLSAFASTQEVVALTAEEKAAKRVEEVMSGMTLKEKVYQMFIVQPFVLSETIYSNGYYTVEQNLINNMATHPVGGIIIDLKNISDAGQLTKLNSDLQESSEIPLVITIDEEGGRVSRLGDLRNNVINAMYSYKDLGPEKAKENAEAICEDLSRFGFNADFAPVADVWSNKQNTVIGDRAFSDNFEQAATLVEAAVGGFGESGIACTLKHFPGHGDTTGDSHTGKVYATKTVEEIKSQEFKPFASGIAAGAPMVMVAHVTVNDLDPTIPATFSSEIINGWLRNELGFKGVVVSDAVNMDALDDWNSEQKAIKAVKAGVDVLLMPQSLSQLEAMANALMAEVQQNAQKARRGADDITEARIDESVRRILTMKYNMGLLGEPAEPNLNPEFTVQYYANIQKLDESGEYPLEIIDTAGGNLPQNVAAEDMNLTNIYLNRVEPEGEYLERIPYTNGATGYHYRYTYKVGTHTELTKVYNNRNFEYLNAPGLRYFNLLKENTNYTLSQVWVLKAGSNPSSVDPSDWDIYTDPSALWFTNTASAAGNNSILIDNGTVIRLVYNTTSQNVTNAADFWDYDISDGKVYKNHNTTGGTYGSQAEAGTSHVYMYTYKDGINSSTNYTGSGAKYAFGNQNTSMGLESEHFTDANGWNNVINVYNRIGSSTSVGNGRLTVYKGLCFGLVTGLGTDGLPVFANGLNVPDIFGDSELKGKTAIDGSSIEFTRDGDTYTIRAVSGPQANATDLDTFVNPKTAGQIRPNGPGTTIHYHYVVYDGSNFDGADASLIFTNNFWPMDAASTFGAPGHDLKFGDVDHYLSGVLKNRGYAGILGTTTTGDRRYATSYFGHPSISSGWPTSSYTDGYPRTLPLSDDGLDHNSFFGMHFDIKFNLDDSYCGPLDYLFFGDDDLWVFLDGQLVCDLGGVHSSVGEKVDLWDYLGGSRAKRDGSATGEHTLSVYYTERGASGSTCFMRFTLPMITVTTPPPAYNSLVVEKEVTGNAGETDKDFTFDLNILNAVGQPLVNDYSYTRYGADGVSVGQGLLHNGSGSFTLKHGEYILVENLPDGAIYTVTESDYSGDGYETTYLNVHSDNPATTGSITGSISHDGLSEIKITNHKDTFGTLKVKKTVTGDENVTGSAIADKNFHFRVVLDDNTISGTYGGMTFTGGVAEFDLKKGQELSAENLPNGVGYTVFENDYTADGFTTTYTGNVGEIDATSVQTAEFVNAYSPSPVDVVLKGHKTLEGWPEDKTPDPVFTFTLDQYSGTYSVQTTVEKEGDYTFSLHFDEPGTYHYRINETMGSVYGVLYDRTEYEVWVYVTDNGSGRLSARVESTSDLANGLDLDYLNSYEVTEATVLKVWNDDNDRDRLRPTSLTVDLYRHIEVSVDPDDPSGEPAEEPEPEYVTSVALDAAHDWTATIHDLLKCDQTHAEYVYTWAESSVPTGYTLTSNNTVGTVTTLTNTHTPDVTSISVTKVWEDNDNEYGIRPSKVIVQLYANGTAHGEAVELNEADNGWAYTWENLPKNADGNPITYTVDEVNTPAEYTKTVTGDAQTGFVITNAFEPELTKAEVLKIWNDGQNQDGTRPGSLNVTLSNGDTVTLSEFNGWRDGKDILPKYNYTLNADGTVTKTPISYTWTESGLPNDYSITNTQTEDIVEGGKVVGVLTKITNTHTPGKVSVPVEKKWEDDGNRDGIRPSKVMVQLYANGSAKGDPVELSEGNHWKYTWTELDEKANGQTIVYTVDETEVPTGYEKDPITGNAQTGYIITNRHTPEKTTVSVSKIWDDLENEYAIRPSKIYVQLKANGTASGEAVELGEGNQWKYTWTELNKNAGGRPITYTVDEVSIPAEYTKSVTGDAQTGYVITNTFRPEFVKAEVQKVWDDSGNQDGNRPETLNVTLSNGETVTLSDFNSWKDGKENLPKYSYTLNADGTVTKTEIDYSWTEAALPTGYSLTNTKVEDITENEVVVGKLTTLTNSYAPGKVSVPVEKKWEDDGNRDGIRPSKVMVQLYANGSAKGDPVELNEGNHWKHTWTELDEKVNGQTIVYTVDETAVPTGYEKDPITGNAQEGYVITNRHTPEKTQVPVEKKWEDEGNQDGIRPAKVMVQLYANGTALGDAVELNEGNQWKHTWTNLNKNDNGRAITYTVNETAVPTGYTMDPITGNAQDGFVITNRHEPGKVSVPVEKKWEDNGNQDGIRPAKVMVQLYANGSAKGDPVELNEGNQWKYTWTGLDEKANGQTIVYTVDETAVPTGYEKDPITGNAQEGYVITNRHTPEKTQVPVEKKWEDEGNQDGIRPAKIMVQLYANGTAQGSAVELSESNQWKHTWTGLDKNANGRPITYTVNETAVPTGYTMDPITGNAQDGFVITNRHEPGKVSVPVEKKWEDEGNQDGIRPAKVMVQLYANGTAQGDAVELSESNQWKHTWTGLDEKANGQTIVYTVDETAVPTGYEKDPITGNAQEGYAITNRHTPEKTTVSVSKIWDDLNNEYAIRPSKIYVQLKANGTASGEAVELGEGNQWKYTWTELNKNAGGRPITYTVDEVSIPAEYTKSVTGDAQTGFVITNTFRPEFVKAEVQKVWDDSGNQDGNRPETLNVTLSNGETVTLSDFNSWKDGKENLPKYSYTLNADGTVTKTEIDYRWTEAALPAGYSLTNTKVEDITENEVVVGKLTTLTNSYAPGKVSVPVEKKWEDDGNRDGIRPAKVMVQLYANGSAKGEPVELNEGNHWKHTWTELDEKANGQTIVYTVDETAVPTGYEKDPITGNAQEGYVITNRHTPEKTQVPVEKKWEDEGNQDGIRPAKVMVQLYANGTALGDPVELNEGNQWKHTWTNLNKNDNGRAITYTVNETAVPTGYTMDPITGNAQEGFVITNRHEPGKVSVPVEKKWEDNGNQDGIRPAKVMVQLYANGSAKGDPVELNEGNQWKYTWTGLDEKANGQTIVYTVDETAVPTGYEKDPITGSAQDGFVITNRHTPEKTEVSVEKVWNDLDNKYGKRPAKVTVQLHANGTAYGEPVDLSATNSWKHTWTGLDKYSNGQAIEYTVTEAPVEGYEPTIEPGTTGGSFVITNSHLGRIDVTKTLVGGDVNKEFTFTLILRDASGEVISANQIYKYLRFASAGAEGTEGQASGDAEGKVTFTLKTGETVEFYNLPLGASYEVTEESGNYTVESSGTTGTTSVEAIPKAEFTNTVKPTTQILPVEKLIAGEPPESMTEEFTFQIEAVGNAPMPKKDTVTIEGAGTGEFDPISYEAVGTYEYRVTELEGNAPGYTYDTQPRTIIVTVTDNNGKLEATYKSNGETVEKIVFTNEYESGSLMIEKIVKGDAADPQKYFTFTVTFTYNGDVLEGEFPYTGTTPAPAPAADGQESDPDADEPEPIEGVISSGGSIKLKHGETVTITGLPVGCEYTVTETGNDDYVVTSVGAVGEIVKDGKAEAIFTNTKTTPPDTGEAILSDNKFMMALSAVVLLDMLFLAGGKRRKNKKVNGSKA